MRNPSLRETLRFLHLWLGLILCLPLVLLGLTGTLLTFQHNLDAHMAVAGGSSQSASAIVAAASKAAPQGQAPSFYIAPTDAGSPATVRFSPPGRGGPGFGAMIAVDPVTLSVQVSQSGGFMRQVHMLHGNLLIEGRDGRSIVGWLGVVMLAMGLSGLVIWWPRPGRWRAAFTVGRGARGVRLHRELHGAVGIWALLVFIAVSFTGVYIAFPETLAGLVGADSRPAPPPKVLPLKDSAPIDIDRAITLAQAGLPDGIVKTVGLPMRPDQPYRINLAHRDAADGAPAVTIYVDPWQARILDTRDPAALAGGAKFAAWQRPVHAGLGLGPVWHVLVGLSGLLPALFAVTGVSMWLLKRKARQRMDARKIPMAEAAE